MATKRKRKAGRVKCLCCSNKAQSRGLCWRCLRAATAAIERGETTEDKLIAHDPPLMLPAQKRGPQKRESGFAKVFKKGA